MGGRQLPYDCEHGVCIDAGDPCFGATASECPYCRIADLERQLAERCACTRDAHGWTNICEEHGVNLHELLAKEAECKRLLRELVSATKGIMAVADRHAALVERVRDIEGRVDVGLCLASGAAKDKVFNAVLEVIADALRGEEARQSSG